MHFRRNKYRVAPVADRTWYGHVYASKAEMLYAQLLDTARNTGQIRYVREQPVVMLGTIKYVPDFLVYPMVGEPYYVDVKGMMTQAFKIKLKLWKESGPGILMLVRRKGQRFELLEEVRGGVAG